MALFTGGDAWLDGSCLLCVHPDGSRLAAARGPHLHILPLLPRGDDSKALSPPPHAQRGRPASPAVPSSPEPVKLWCPASSSSPVTCPEDITAMTWLAFVRPSGTAVSSGQTQVQQQGRSLRPTGAGAAAGPGAGTAHGVAGEAGDAGEGYSPPRRRGGSLGSSGGSGQWGQWAAGGGSRSSSGRGGAGGVFHGVQAMLEAEEQRREADARAAAPGAPVPHPVYSHHVLLTGTRSGCLQLHCPDSGRLLLRQGAHAGSPVAGISVRTWRMGMRPDSGAEDVTVGFGDAFARLAAWDLRAAVAAAGIRAAAVAAAHAGGAGGSSGGHAATHSGRPAPWSASPSSSAAPPALLPDVRPLGLQKWQVPMSPHAAGPLRGGPRCGVVCCGARPRDLYALLQGIGPSSSSLFSPAVGPSASAGKTVFLAGGERPVFLAALEVDEQKAAAAAEASGGGRGSSSSASVTGTVAAVASWAVGTVAGLTGMRGIRTWVANPLQLSPHPHPAVAAPATAPQPPYPSFDDPLPPPTPSSSAATTTPAPGTPPPPASRPTPTPSLGPAAAWRSIRDDGRSLQPPPPLQYPGAGPGPGAGSAGGAGGGGPPWSGPCLCPAPRGCLVAAVDCLGRVLLVEAVGGALQVTRMWKGYRDAQVGWMEVPYCSALQLAAAAAGRNSSGGSEGGVDADPHGLDSGHGGDGGSVLVLVLYAPRRQTLELWLPLQGQGGRLAATAVPPRARLLQRGGGGAAGAELGTWRAAAAAGGGNDEVEDADEDGQEGEAGTPVSCLLCVACGAGGGGCRGGGGKDRRQGGGDGCQGDAGGQEGDGKKQGEGEGEGHGGGFELWDVGSLFGLPGPPLLTGALGAR